MASLASKQAVVVFPHDSRLCPPPLHVKKKSRRATLYRRILRKPSYQSECGSVYGPLDDLINEISGDIWASASESSFVSSPYGCEDTIEASFNWQNPLKASSTCSITPLPVSRIPSDQPLTIRKNRSNRSTASSSSAGYSMAFSMGSNDGGHALAYTGSRISTLGEAIAPWTMLSAPSQSDTEADIRSSTVCTENSLAQQALKGIRNVKSAAQPPKRRPSRMRHFTHGFPRYYSAGSSGIIRSNIPSHTASDIIRLPIPAEQSDKSRLVSRTRVVATENALQTFMSGDARNESIVGSMFAQVAARPSSQFEIRNGFDNSYSNPVQPAVSSNCTKRRYSNRI